MNLKKTKKEKAKTKAKEKIKRYMVNEEPVHVCGRKDHKNHYNC